MCATRVAGGAEVNRQFRVVCSSGKAVRIPAGMRGCGVQVRVQRVPRGAAGRRYGPSSENVPRCGAERE